MNIISLIHKQRIKKNEIIMTIDKIMFNAQLNELTSILINEILKIKMKILFIN